jgi:hypothetical protein
MLAGIAGIATHEGSGMQGNAHSAPQRCQAVRRLLNSASKGTSNKLMLCFQTMRWLTWLNNIRSRA